MIDHVLVTDRHTEVEAGSCTALHDPLLYREDRLVGVGTQDPQMSRLQIKHMSLIGPHSLAFNPR